MNNSPAIEIGHLDVVYEDEYFVAVNKPTGMIVHRVDASDSQPALLQCLRDQLGYWVYPIHRLDQPTSGIVLVGKSPAAANRLMQLFLHQKIRKYYQALVYGWTYTEGCINLPLDTPGRSERCNETIVSGRQPALSVFSTIRRYALIDRANKADAMKFSWLELAPKTGRFHQLRRHLNAIGCPILGDYRYGNVRSNAWLLDTLATDAMMLSAILVAFEHPYTQQSITIRVPRHASFETVLDHLATSAIAPGEFSLPPQPKSLVLDESLRRDLA